MKVLISRTAIQRRIRELARAISRDHCDCTPVVIGVLKGSFVFMADLVRRLDIPVTCDFLRVSSYGDGTATSGSVRIEFDTTQPLKGKHVILVEDIVDTGLTLKAVIAYLKAKGPRSLKVCALLRKKARLRVKVRVDYIGFDIPDAFVVGYGLDHAGQHRNLPDIRAIEQP